MNYFDNHINLQDRDSLMPLRALDSSGHQKIINFVDSLRALVYTFKVSWYAGSAGDSCHRTKPVCLHHGFLAVSKDLLKLEPHEVTSQHLARALESLRCFKEVIEAIISKAPVSTTAFTSEVEYAKQVYPLIITAQKSLEAWWEESHNNIMGSLILEAHQDAENLRISDSISEGCYSKTSKTVGYQENLGDPENYYFKKIQDILAKMLDQSLKEPGTFKALMGDNLYNLLSASANFYNVKGQSILCELKAARSQPL